MIEYSREDTICYKNKCTKRYKCLNLWTVACAKCIFDQDEEACEECDDIENCRERELESFANGCRDYVQEEFDWDE